MSDIVLHQYPPLVPDGSRDRGPSVSPFCWKAHMALRLKGLAYRTVDTWLPVRSTPHGKVPYVVWDGEGLEDSTHVVRTIDARVPDVGPRLVPEDPRRAAEAHLLEDWGDESLFHFCVWAKFIEPSSWAVYSRVMGDSMPVLMRLAAPAVARRQLRENLRAQGLLRRDERLIRAELERHLDAIDARLGRLPFLQGEEPTIADLGVAAPLLAATVGVAPAFEASVRRRERLWAWLEHLRETTRT